MKQFIDNFTQDMLNIQYSSVMDRNGLPQILTSHLEAMVKTVLWMTFPAKNQY